MARHRILRIVTYNVLSLIQIGRSQEISTVLDDAHCLMLQGTRRRHHDGPVTISRAGDHMVYDWGFGRSSFVTRAAGVQLRVHRRVARPCDIAAIHSPPPVLQGRGGAVRVRHPAADLLFVTLYVAPRYGNAAHDAVYMKGTRELFGWLHGVLDNAPARTTVFLGMDLNDTLGIPPGGITDASGVGSLHPAPEHFAAGLLRNTLDKYDLAAYNTYSDGSDTYYGVGKRSRIDYICGPRGLLSSLRGARVLRRQGRSLQMINCRRPMDHYPVEVIVDYELNCATAVDPDGFDPAALVRAALSCTARRPFIAAVEEHMAQHHDEWRDEATRLGIDQAWDNLVADLRGVARRFFPRQRAAAPPPSRRAEVRALLTERAALRHRLANSDELDAITEEIRDCA